MDKVSWTTDGLAPFFHFKMVSIGFVKLVPSLQTKWMVSLKPFSVYKIEYALTHHAALTPPMSVMLKERDL